MSGRHRRLHHAMLRIVDEGYIRIRSIEMMTASAEVLDA
jgi:hypothetical protein